MSWLSKLLLTFLFAGAVVILMPWTARPQPPDDPLFAALYRANHKTERTFTLEVAGSYYECDLKPTDY